MKTYCFGSTTNIRVIALILFSLVMVMPRASGQLFEKVIDGFSSPESVTSDGEFIYVSNVGVELKPQEKDGDGYISKLSKDGEVINKKFLPVSGKLNAPKGMIVVDNVLYTADIDRVVGFDLDSGKQVFELDFSSEKTSFVNAFTQKDDSTLFVSATDIGKIYTVDLNKKTFKALPLPEIRGANGLHYNAGENQLYVVGFGKEGKPTGEFGRISWKDDGPYYEKLVDKKGYLDGLVQISKNRFIYSDWVEFKISGVLIMYDKSKQQSATMRLPSTIGGPADFWYDETTQWLYIPAMMEGKVIIHAIRP